MARPIRSWVSEQQSRRRRCRRGRQAPGRALCNGNPCTAARAHAGAWGAVSIWLPLPPLVLPVVPAARRGRRLAPCYRKRAFRCTLVPHRQSSCTSSPARGRPLCAPSSRTSSPTTRWVPAWVPVWVGACLPGARRWLVRQHRHRLAVPSPVAAPHCTPFALAPSGGEDVAGGRDGGPGQCGEEGDAVHVC